MLIVEDDDLVEVEHFARERTADHQAVSVLDVDVVHAELVWSPAHCPARRVVTSQLARYCLSSWTYSGQGCVKLLSKKVRFSYLLH